MRAELDWPEPRIVQVTVIGERLLLDYDGVASELVLVQAIDESRPRLISVTRLINPEEPTTT